jgi:peptidyl-prolyl cis-trans isomerase D
MLQQLRDQTQSTGFKVLVISIILVLVLFGFGATNVFSVGDPEVAEVGDFAITENILGVETERERRRILGQMGADFDPNDLDRLQLQQFALSQLINRQVLYQAAADLNIAVSAEAVNEELLTSPAYQRDGAFDQALYLQQVQMLGFTPLEFMQEISNALGSDQLRNGVQESALLTDWEVAEVYSVLEQRRDVAYLPLLVADFANNVEVTEEETKTRYEEEQQRYMTARSVDVEYLTFSTDSVAASMDIKIDEDELQRMYASDREAAMEAAERDSAHILFEVTDDRNDAAILELARSVKARLDAGEAFAELAQELSDDPGSALTGGALGSTGKGVFDPMFEDALWGLSSVGEVSEPVRTEFGYHLIKLVGLTDVEYPSFTQQRDVLEQRVRQEQAVDAFADLQEDIERSAYDERFGLTETAAAFDLEVVNVTNLTRESAALEGQGVLSAAEVRAAIFSDDLLAGENSPVINPDDETSVVVRVVQDYPPEALPFDEVEVQISAEIRREKALAEIEAAKDNALTQLQQGIGVSQVATELGKRWTSLELVVRTQAQDETQRKVVEHAFTLPRPNGEDKSIGSVELDDGGSALVAVTRVVMGDISSATDDQREQLRQALARRNTQAEFAAFFRAAEETVGVTRNIDF